MKNFKKIALGLIVGAMAIGFSAFTNAKTNNHKSGLSNYTFSHPANNTSNTAADFVYHANLAGCNQSSNICTAVWSQSTAPTEGSSPTSSATEVSISNGNYR